MPRRFQNLHQNFAAGEISPRMSLRVDTNAYANALSRSTNFYISSQGGAVYREGFQHIGYAPSNQPFRLFQFHRGGDKSDILIEVSEGLIRYWIDDEPSGEPHLAVDLFTILSDEDDGELLTDEDDGEFLTAGVMLGSNPYTLTDLDDLYFTNQDKYGILCHPNHPPIYITIERNGEILAQAIPKERIPQFAYLDTSSPGYASQAANWTITFPTSWTGKNYLYFVTYNGIQANYEVTGMGISYSFSGTDTVNRDNIQAGLIAAATRQGLSTTFVVSTTSSNLIYTVAVSGENSAWKVDTRIAYWPYYVPGISDLVIATDPPITQPGNEGTDAYEEPAWSYPTWVLHNDIYYQCIAVHRSEAGALGNEPGVGAEAAVYWTALGIAKPEGFDYQYPDGNDWADAQTYAPWDRGFPTVCVFHDQRLLLMANKDNPTAVYGSALGYYFNFQPGPNDDDPFLFVLDSSDTPQIKWARSQHNLTLGTSNGEWSLTADVTITPTDIHAEQQNNARSQLALPVQIDTEIFYIEQGGRRLRVTRFFDEANSLTSIDASLMAEHLIATQGIKRLAGSYIPEVQITIVRKNGQPVFLTYEKNQPVMAYTEGETDGVIHDCAGYFALNANRDYTYFATQRNGNYVLERLRYPCSKVCTPLTANKVVHLDGWVRGTVVGSTITGLAHLEGKEIAVLIDDAWQIGTYVVQAGQVALSEDYTGRWYAVGLRYIGEFTTFETTDIENGKTGLGTKRRWNRLFTRLLNSALPRIYTDRASDRTPSVPMNVSENVREGLQDIQQNTVGYGNGTLTVLQDRPYPTHVLGFFGEYQVEDR